MTSTRANAFGDLSDFQPRPPAKKAPTEPLREDIDRLARESGFPSRQPLASKASSARPSVRRHVTGRNQQINVKATPETIAKFYRLADERQVVLGELLELALEALEGAPKA